MGCQLFHQFNYISHPGTQQSGTFPDLRKKVIDEDLLQIYENILFKIF